MTQKQKAHITLLQRNALNAYCNFCNEVKEIPRMDTTTLIMGCNEAKRLSETIKIFEENTGKGKTE